MSSTQISTERQSVTGVPAAATVDLKLEVVAIPVSDVDRSKAFYERIGMDSRRRFHGREGLSSGAIDTAWIAMLDSPVHDGGAWLCSGNVPRRLRPRGGTERPHRARGERERRVPFRW